jgi:Ras-related GTP-binding protein A/B
MDSHLTAQSSTVFRSVHSLIYIFDAESPELLTSDTAYFLKCLRTLRDQNPPSTSSNSSGEDGGPTVFVLLHKMDLVPVDMQASKLAEFEAEVTKKARESGYQGGLQFYGTSIWNETLYKVRMPRSCTAELD